MITPARVAAYDVLRAVEGGTATLAEALDSCRGRLADSRDQALTTEIAVGTVRWQGALDHLIARCARRPTTRLDTEVLIVLRLAAYQLLHLDRVPVAAVVSDAVELTRRAGKRSAAGMVNASLRALAGQRDAPSLPERPAPDAPGFRAAALDFLATTLSHPRWVADRWIDRLGFDTACRWAALDNQPAPLTVRVNRLVIDPESAIAALADEGVRVEPTRFAPDGLVAVEGNPLATTLARSGAVLAQDEPSQLIARLVRAGADDTILDVCAAPGGKTTALAAARRDAGTIVAIDVRPRRMRLLAATVRRAKARSIRLVRADATRPLPLRTRVAWALLDAPCSGLGTIRRDPEIRWRRSPEDLAALATTQLHMLERVADAIATGGSLIYATCSSEPEENEDVVERFLAADGGFELADPAGGIDELAPFIGPDGYLRTSPVTHGLSAFFGARLRRVRETTRNRQNLVTMKDL